MLKEAIEKLVSLGENKTYKIDGRTYSDNKLSLIEEPVYRPGFESFNSLDAIVQIVKKEVQKANLPLFIRVSDYDEVRVFDSLDAKNGRSFFYMSQCDTPDFSFGWEDYERAIIRFRSQFIQTKETEYVLDLLSKITDENSVTAEDNGLSQSVETRKGVALKSRERVKTIIKLIPYRTFLEVEQPESEFLLRLREGGQVGLFEADGGMWKLTAKKSIRKYLEEELKDLIEAGSVVVMI